MKRRLIRFTVMASLLAGLAQAADEAALFVELTRSPEPRQALALARCGEAAVPHFKRALRQGDRLAAVCAWSLAREPLPGTDAALRHLLRVEDQVAGYWAARALGRLPDPENVQALAGLLSDERLGYWELSAGGVGRLTDLFGRSGRQSAPAPAWMPNLRVAYAGMESLGELGGDLAASTLLRALESDQYLIRYGAARGLGRLAQRGWAGTSDSLRHAAALKLGELERLDPVLVVRLGARQAAAMLEPDPPSKPNLLATSPLWSPAPSGSSATFPTTRLGAEPVPELPGIAFIKTPHRSDSNLGFRDSYFFPKTPKYASGENLYTLTPAERGGELRNLTQLSHGEVQGPEVSLDGARLLFAMRRDRDRDGFHIFEINRDGTGLRQITRGNCNDVDPCYLPDGRIAFCSDRAGYQEYYHQERSRVIYVMNNDGSGVEQITFNPNQDYEPLALRDGRLLYGSYRFYAQDGSEGPLPGEFMGLARIETVLRAANPDGSGDDLYYGSMRGSFFSPMRPMPFSDQWAGWHPRGYHVGVSVSQPRELAGRRMVCVTPAGLTVLDANRVPLDCEVPIYPEVVNLAGGEEVYIHNYDQMNPAGRYTTPYPVAGDWILVSHAPWHDLRVNGFGLYLMNLATRELRLVYDDPQMADVDPVPLLPRRKPALRVSTLGRSRDTGMIYCNSVFNSDLPYDRAAVRSVRVLEGILMGQSIAANASFRTRLLGTVPLHADGSFYVEVPAERPIRFELEDGDGRMLVHETAFNYVRAGEVRGCVGCHQPRHRTGLNEHPQALDHEPARVLPAPGDLIYFGRTSRPYNLIHRP